MRKSLSFEDFKPKKVSDRFIGCPSKEDWLRTSNFILLKKKFFDKADDPKDWQDLEKEAYKEFCVNFKGRKGQLDLYQVYYVPQDRGEFEHYSFEKALGPIDAHILYYLKQDGFDVTYDMSRAEDLAEIVDKNYILEYIKKQTVFIENAKEALK